MQQLANYINAATGWDMTMYELMKVGEKANTMALSTTARGFTAPTTHLPQRMFEPLQNGKLKGVSVDRKEFEEMLTIHYNIAGWDDQGASTYAKLADWICSGARAAGADRLVRKACQSPAANAQTGFLYGDLVCFS